jgi:hypothetical protein
MVERGKLEHGKRTFPKRINPKRSAALLRIFYFNLLDASLRAVIF